MAYAGHLWLSGLKNELVKDRYVVLCTVTMSSPVYCHNVITEAQSEAQKTNTPKTTKTQKHNPHKTHTKNNPHEQSSNVLFGFVLLCFCVFVFWLFLMFFCSRRPLPFGGSHLRLPSGPAGIRTTTGSLSALARPTPYQLSYRVAFSVVFGVLFFCFVLRFGDDIVTVHRTTYRSFTSSLLRPLNRRRPSYAIINQLIPICNRQ